MIGIYLLEDDDVIQADDWIRPLNLMYNGQSGELHTTSIYGGTPINRLGWIPVKYYCPAFINQTVADYRRVMKEFHRYELARGPIPKSHQEHLTREELKLLNWRIKSCT